MASRLPTRKASGTPPKSHWSPAESPEIDSFPKSKRRASAGGTNYATRQSAPSGLPKKQARPSTTGSAVPPTSSGSTLPRLKSIRSIFGRRPASSGNGGASTSASTLDSNAKPPLSHHHSSSTSSKSMTVDEFVKLGETTSPPVKRASILIAPQPSSRQQQDQDLLSDEAPPSALTERQRKTLSYDSSSSTRQDYHFPSRAPSKDTLRIIPPPESPARSSQRHSQHSSGSGPPSPKRVSRDFVRSENEPSLASLRAGVPSPISLSKRNRNSLASPTKPRSLASPTNQSVPLPVNVNDDMAYRRLSISPKLPETDPPPKSQPFDRGLLNESPLGSHYDEREREQVKDAAQLNHHQSTSSLTSAYSTAASNQPESTASEASFDMIVPGNLRPTTPEEWQGKTTTPAAALASPRQARREALPPEEGSPGLNDLQRMFAADQQQNPSFSAHDADDAPIYSDELSALRRSASAVESGTRERRGSGQVKRSSPVVVKPTVDLSRSASVAERVNNFESVIVEASRGDRRALRQARSKSDVPNTASSVLSDGDRPPRSRLSHDVHPSSHLLRPASSSSRPVISPLDNLIRDLSESTNLSSSSPRTRSPGAGSTRSVDSPTLLIRPPSGASVHEQEPRNRIRGSMTVEEMEREIARMEAELALGGSPAVQSRATLGSAEPSPSDESALSIPPPSLPDNASETTKGSLTDVTPRTAKKWSIVEVEQAYSRMKDLLGSTRSGGYSESTWSDAGDVDVDHAFERAIRPGADTSFRKQSLDSSIMTTSEGGTPLVSQLNKFPPIPGSSLRGQPLDRVTTWSGQGSLGARSDSLGGSTGAASMLNSLIAEKLSQQEENVPNDVFTDAQPTPQPPLPSRLVNVRTNESLRSTTTSGSGSEGEGWKTPLTSPPSRFDKMSTRPLHRVSSSRDETHESASTVVNGNAYQPLDAVLEDVASDPTLSSRSLPSSQLTRSNTVDTWFPATPARLPLRRAAHRGLGLVNSEQLSQHQQTSSLLSIRSMDKLEIYFKYTAAKAELDRAGLERDALLDALEETRAALEDVRSQRDFISQELQRERTAAMNMKKYLGNDSNDQSQQKIEELVRANETWEARARDALHELDIARTEAEALAQMVLEGREREDNLEHDNLILAARLASFEGSARTITDSADRAALMGTSNGNDFDASLGARRTRTPSRNSIDSTLAGEVGESPLLTQRMAFGPKSSYGSLYSPLRSRKEQQQSAAQPGSPTITLSRIAALSAARKASLDRANGFISAETGVVNGTAGGQQRHVSNTSTTTTSTTSDFGDHLPPRDWLTGSSRGRMGELDEADERFLSDLTSQ